MTARIYVGTYGKYNGGSIAGKWLNLEDYADKDEFLKACAELHKDEPDPEFMFQDYEGFPRTLYNESYIDPAIWEWLELDEDEQKLLEVYNDWMGTAGDIKDATEAFLGKYRSPEDWAAEWLEDTGGLEGVPEHLKNYIDYEAYARDARLGGDVYFADVDGEVWVFHSL